MNETTAMELRTERLELRPFAAEDADELLNVFHDADIRRWLLDDEVVSASWVAEEIRQSDARFAQGRAGLWAVRVTGQPAIVGIIGFRDYFEPPEPQLLYGMLPSVWGRGLATEAARAACAYAFEQAGFDRVCSSTDLPNTASVCLLERLGMTRTKITDLGPNGTVFYEVRREAWAGD